MALELVCAKDQKLLADEIFGEIAELQKNSQVSDLFLIVPEASKMDVERVFLEKYAKAGIMGLEVISFGRFCHKILDEVGRGFAQYADEIGKSMLIHRSMQDLTGELTYFANLGLTTGFIKDISMVLGEMDRFMLTPDLLREKSLTIEDSLTAAKLKELALIMDSYKKTLEAEGVKDSQDLYTDAADLLELASQQKKGKNPTWPLSRLLYFLDSPVYVLGFGEHRDFTAQEYRLLRILSEQTKVKISIMAEAEGQGDENEADSSFFSERRAYVTGDETLANLKRNFPQAPVSYLQGRPHSKPDIKVFFNNSAEEEIRRVAGKIRRLVAEENCRYKDIILMSPNFEAYKDSLRMIFSKAGIPLYIDEKKAMKDTALGRSMAALMKILKSGWKRVHVLSYLRSGYAEGSLSQSDDFELFAKAGGINYRSRIFERGRYKDSDGEDRQDLWDYIGQNLEAVDKLEEAFKSCDRVGDFCEKLRDFLREASYEKKTEDFSRKLKEIGREDSAISLTKAWNALVHILDQMTLTASSVSMDFEEFSALLSAGMEEAMSATIPHFADSVYFCPLRSFPASSPSSVFVFGLTEEVFPGRVSSEGLLDNNDRKHLSAAIGARIPSKYEDKAHEDIFMAHAFLKLPRDKIFLSAPTGYDDASAFIKYLIKEREIKPEKPDETETSLPDNDYFYDRDSLIQGLLSRLPRLGPEWLEASRLLESDDRSAAKLEAGLRISKLADIDLRIDRLLSKNHFGSTPVLSASEIERYASCAFRHFCRDLLALKQEEVRRVETYDFGNLTHSIVEYAVSDFIDRYAACRDAEEARLLLQEYENRDFTAFAHNLLEVSIEKNLADMVEEPGFFSSFARAGSMISAEMLRMIFTGISEKELLPTHVEWRFSPSKGNNPEGLTPEGRRILFAGIVDRIDTGEDEFSIFDYKSSGKRVDYDSWLTALDVQLPLYLLAYLKARPDSRPREVSYLRMQREIFSLKDHEIERNEEVVDRRLRSTAGLSSRSKEDKSEELLLRSREAMEEILRLADKIMDACHPVYPGKLATGRLPCDYCEYKAICGFDKDAEYRILAPLQRDDVNV